jgi:hypothetical protein
MMRRVKPPPKRETPAKAGGQTVQGKTLILGFLAALVVVVGLLFWVGLSGNSTHVAAGRPGVGFRADEGDDAAATGTSTAKSDLAWDGGAIEKTIMDRKVRDELRKRLLAAWAAESDPEVAAAAKQGRFLPAPTGPDGGRMDPKYIQEVIRGEFFPMARKCYEELVTRKKDAKGRIEMSFTIVADEKQGGILEDVEASGSRDSGLADEKMTTCMRESMSTLAFRPPAHGGVVTVVYPIEFSPGDDDDDNAKAHDR